MMDELIEQFVLEGRELVQLASDDLLALEQTPGDGARLASAFRAVHTLKGSAGLFDFAAMTDTLHAAEDLLGALRGGRVTADRACIDAVLACIGAAEAWIEAVAETGRLPDTAPAQASGLIQALRAPLGHADAAPSPLPAGSPAPSFAATPAPAWLAGLTARGEAAAGAPARTGVRYRPTRDCFFRGDDPLALAALIPELLALRLSEGEAQDPERFDPFACTLVIEALSAAPPEQVRGVFRLVPDQAEIHAVPPPPAPPPAPAPAPAPPPAPPADAGVAPAARALRVEAARIDMLAEVAGELVVAKNRLAHLTDAAARASPELARALAASLAEFERLVGRLHRAVSHTRLVPLGQTTRRLARPVREIAGRLGKPVRLDSEGVETEADRGIVDALFEPLLHVLRNALDHGIEDAAGRRAAGKPSEGRIHLRASREADRIVVSVSDDGAGIDPAVLRRAAKARGVAGEAAIGTMDDDAVLDLLFAPGFSTANAVSELSGRGVGLDAVRAAMRALGGDAAIASTPGRGTTVRLSVPQAVMVSSVVLVEAGGHRFGVPIDAIAETARIPADAILPIRDGRACVLKGRTVPVLRLAELLALPAPSLPVRSLPVPSLPAPAEARLLVAGSAGQRVGIEVDRVGARLEVALRPLEGLLAALPGVLGTSLLGDGGVLLVLDLAELIQ